MSGLAASSLVTNMQSEILRKNEVITAVLECSTQTLKDKKFWKVRYVVPLAHAMLTAQINSQIHLTNGTLLLHTAGFQA